jgi:hypothetical protein
MIKVHVLECIMTELRKGRDRSGTVSPHFATMHQHDHNYCKQHHRVVKIGYIVNVTLHMKPYARYLSTRWCIYTGALS